MDAGIDFLTLTTREYMVKSISGMGQNRRIIQGKTEEESRVLGINKPGGQIEMLRADNIYYNEKDLYQCTIDNRGIAVTFNPSKIRHPYELVTDTKEVKRVGDMINKRLTENGILLNFDTAIVSRLDLTKQDILPRGFSTYIQAFSMLKGKRMKKTNWSTGYRWGNGNCEVQSYDKGIESKLPINNLIRFEDKFKHTDVVQKICGFNNYGDVLKSDNKHLTGIYNRFITDKLFSDKVGYQSALDFENEVDKLKHFKDMGRNAVMKYLLCNSLEDFILKFGKIDVLFDIMAKAGFNRSSISRERQNILKLLQYAEVSDKADVTIVELINELKTRFAS